MIGGSQERVEPREQSRTVATEVVTVNDVLIAATPETILVNYQCMMRIGLSFGADQGMVLNVLEHSQI